ncbi:putative collagen triple helix repeat-containing protein 1 [Apostichopus japonicus]|uniref:Putative collagen triple helix repeat-containing protein 1 n=1 Tax=Stichopus japonicus TaxID=307972 RepID=A0A2G8L9N6_STIJA|nr:putative collagen triple helix repeat-containing protein 1 [Apostichopus japonicus]
MYSYYWIKLTLVLFSLLIIDKLIESASYSGCSRGEAGLKGDKGNVGLTGDPGQGEFLDYNNWRQCAWYSGNGNDYDTNIYDCVFTKQYSDTALWVYYGGNLRVYGCSGCCKRWYITFNGNECSSPTVIDAVVYQENTNEMNLHRHRSFEGYCHNVGAGEIHVRLAVGDCSGFGNYDASTGWNSASRLIVREVPATTY